MLLYCPHCGTPLDEGFLAAQGSEFDCPECDRTIRLEELQGAEAAAQVRGAEGGSSADGGSVVAEEPISDVPPPGRVECVQKDSQLIILILPGSNRVVRSLGCMAIFWLGIVATVTGMFLPVVLRGNMPGDALPFVAIFAIVFWGAGTAMLYFWLMGRFGKTYVLVEPDRVVIRHVLFGRERLQEYPLDAASHAELVESYRQNNQPVYKVAIRTGSDVSASFGTFLSDEEKQWLVARINRHLGVPMNRKVRQYRHA